MHNLHITAQQIRIFESVARNLSYTKAAQELHLTQPAVSIQMKRLEENNEIKLFEMAGKQLTLTPYGKRLYQSCQRILEELKDFNSYVQATQNKIDSELRLAIVTPAKYFMPYILKAFLNRYPDVKPVVTVINRRRILDEIQKNQYDLIVMGRVPEQLNMSATSFYENGLVVVSPPKHRLVKEKSIPLEEIAQERFLMREPGSGVRDATEALFQQHNLELNPYMELGSTEAIKQAVMAGLGISILPQYAVRIEKRYRHLETLDVEGFPIKRTYYIARMNTKAPTPASEAFLDFVQSIDIPKLLAMSDTR
ncbi:LysR substrate-binding domain-containing protein [Galenea microaerophila]